MIILGNFLGFASLALIAFAMTAAALRLSSGRRKWEEAAVRATHAATVMVVISSAVLWAALIRADFTFEYVAEYTSTSLPTLYRVTAFWAGQAGSLLFWLLVLMLFLSLALALYRKKHPEWVPPLVLLAGGSAFFFNLLLKVFSDPFASAVGPIVEGAGLNPLLQNVGMVFHPPLLFLGYVGFTIPFALALGSLSGGEPSNAAFRAARTWSLVSWVFLTVGIVLGAQWAYVELGWGGYWAWDPVENASLIPWLSATAFLHTITLQNRRGMLRRWNTFLAAVTFLLCVFGTFITRSGFIQSVHAFQRSSIGYWFLAFIALFVLISLFVLGMGWRKLRAPNRLDRVVSREGLFVLTGWLLMAFLALVLVGTVYPKLHRDAKSPAASSQGVEAAQGEEQEEAASSQDISVSARFFNRAAAPFGVGLLLLLALCPVLGWRRTSGRSAVLLALLTMAEAAMAGAVCYFWLTPRQADGRLMASALAGMGIAAILNALYDLGKLVAARKRASGSGWPASAAALFGSGRKRMLATVIHVGLVFLCLGITGSAYFPVSKTVEASPGDKFQIGDYTVFYRDFVQEQDPEKRVYRALLDVERGGRKMAALTPELNVHRLHEQPMREVSIHTTWKEDLYVIFSPINDSGYGAFEAKVNPVVLWIWIGSLLMMVGAVWAAFPVRPKRGPACKQGE